MNLSTTGLRLSADRPNLQLSNSIPPLSSRVSRPSTGSGCTPTQAQPSATTAALSCMASYTRVYSARVGVVITNNCACGFIVFI